MRVFFSFIILLNFIVANAQVKLKPFIGLKTCPADQDTVSRSLNINSEGTEPGLKTGSTINNFKLYGLNNDSLDIAVELTKKKHILLINGSFSCPFFRRTLYFFDSIAQNNKNLNCFIIYSIEAHPDYPFICPYTDEVNPIKMNEYEDVHITQHRTYKDRKDAARLMLARRSPKIPVYLDGPGNEWVNHFGSIADIAYIIDTKGKVKYKYIGYKVKRSLILRDLNSLD